MKYCHNIRISMEPVTIALICITIGALCLIIEALSPGFFMLIPGMVFMILGVLGYFIDDFFTSWYLLVTMVVVTFLSTVLTIKLYQILAKPVPPETLVAETMIGKSGKVTVATEPGTIRGKVRIGFDIWSATSDEVIAAGSDIVVYEAEGVHVKVKIKEN